MGGPWFTGIVGANVGFVRRSRFSIVCPSATGKDPTPSAFLLACASGVLKPDAEAAFGPKRTWSHQASRPRARIRLWRPWTLRLLGANPLDCI